MPWFVAAGGAGHNSATAKNAALSLRAGTSAARESRGRHGLRGARPRRGEVPLRAARFAPPLHPPGPPPHPRLPLEVRLFRCHGLIMVAFFEIIHRLRKRDGVVGGGLRGGRTFR